MCVCAQSCFHLRVTGKFCFSITMEHETHQLLKRVLDPHIQALATSLLHWAGKAEICEAMAYKSGIECPADQEEFRCGSPGSCHRSSIHGWRRCRSARWLGAALASSAKLHSHNGPPVSWHFTNLSMKFGPVSKPSDETWVVSSKGTNIILVQ